MWSEGTTCGVKVAYTERESEYARTYTERESEYARTVGTQQPAANT